MVPISVPERELFIDNLLVRIHLIIEMILVDRPCHLSHDARTHTPNAQPCAFGVTVPPLHKFYLVLSIDQNQLIMSGTPLD